MAELRWASREDIDSILPLLEEYHQQEGFAGYSRERMGSVLHDLFALPNRGRIVVATEDGGLIGYALVIRRPSFEWASDVAVIDEIFVKGKARDRGLGRRIIGFVEEYAASEGLPKITLEVSNRNVSAREFYRSVGFTRIDREIYARVVAGPR